MVAMQLQKEANLSAIPPNMGPPMMKGGPLNSPSTQLRSTNNNKVCILQTIR